MLVFLLTLTACPWRIGIRPSVNYLGHADAGKSFHRTRPIWEPPGEFWASHADVQLDLTILGVEWIALAALATPLLFLFRPRR